MRLLCPDMQSLGCAVEPMLQNKARKTGQGGAGGSISLSNPLSI